MMEGLFWSLVILAGPLILGGAIAYALLRRRRLTRSERIAERKATEELYSEKEDA